MEEHLGAVREGEAAVAELLDVILFVTLILLGEVELGHSLVHRDRGSLGDLICLEFLDPVAVVVNLAVDERAHQGGDVLGGFGGDASGCLDLLGDDVADSLDGLVSLEPGVDGLQLLESLAAHGARLRVGDLLLGLVQRGHELGEERRGVLGILNELGHVVDDHGAHALGGGGPDAEAEEEERRDEREGRSGHRLNKGGGRELLHALDNLLVVDGGSDESGDERLDVAVID
mmetsp:Transcript_3620/g.15897  ORF Transcript_3620/g.15897 Transcript_3620/m.15897 type:complete len:231 (+) Transcript_3620:967-1659(+)